MSIKLTPKLSAKQKALIEHYGYGILAASWGAHALDPHASVKSIAIKGIVGGLLAPILARVNPKSLVNKIDATTGAPDTLTAPIVNTVIADANKVVAENK